MENKAGLEKTEKPALEDLPVKPGEKLSGSLASLKFTFALLPALILLALAGAWLPQTDQISQQELLARFGSDGVSILTAAGLTDVYHSWIFLSAIALLFLNLVACTAVTMAPRVRNRIKPQDFRSAGEIETLKILASIPSTGSTDLERAAVVLRSAGYQVDTNGRESFARKGKLGWWAAPVTHLGLFILLAGSCVSGLTGYSGQFSFSPGSSIKLKETSSKKPMIGFIPDLTVRLLSTSRELYQNGRPRQWSSKVEIREGARPPSGGALSVNNPFSYKGIDFYQSDWSISEAKLRLAGEEVKIPLSEMAGEYMGVFPLLPHLLMIVAVGEPDGKARIFLKSDESHNPKFLAEVPPQGSHMLGRLKIEYRGTTTRDGLQFKYDPGLPLIYLAFGVIFLGALLVVLPSIRIWIAPSDDGTSLLLGSDSSKFRKSVLKEFKDIRHALEQGVSKGGGIES
ncbi:MAG: cytochrome c biogenesis protein ResB [Cyanobacteria bacterium HKST-UBA02]|nr:cytochrome c biogenesis protein ResB [Cyanobacteria bacterium HKST-UBA02]